MKNIILGIAVCFTTSVNSQNGANIEFKITSSKGQTGSMKINFSEFGSMSEFNMVIPQMPGGGIVMKNLTQKSNPDVTYTINDKSKSYSENKKTEASKEDTKTYEVKKIGEEKVNGYNCVHAMVTSGVESEEIWNTKDIKEFDKYSETFKNNKRMGSQKRDDALKAAGCDGFPVKTVHKGNEREGDMTMELVKMEKKTFSKSDFDIPADYTKNGSGAGAGAGAAGMKTQQEIMNMTPEERAKYIEEMKKKYQK